MNMMREIGIDIFGRKSKRLSVEMQLSLHGQPTDVAAAVVTEITLRAAQRKHRLSNERNTAH